MAQDPNQNPNLNPDPFAQQYNPNVYNPNQQAQPLPPDPYAQDFAVADPAYGQNLNYAPTDYNAPQYDPNQFSTQVSPLDPSIPATYNPNPDYTTNQPDPNIVAPTVNQAPYGEYPQDNTQPINTFTEKKAGNRNVLIILGAVVAVLLIATGILVYINITKNTGNNSSSSSSSVSSSTSSSSSSSSVSSSVTNVSLTGGPNTPATLARKFSATQMPADWILKKYTKPDRDDNGVCQNKNVCAESIDADNDGLTNIEEYNFDTDPLKSDTDKDLIADGDEVYVYYSNPNLKDTDKDTYDDGSELNSCFDMNTTVTSKMNTVRLSQIATSASFKPLHEPTIATLKKAGATSSDLQKGVVESKCSTVVSSSTSSISSTATI